MGNVFMLHVAGDFCVHYLRLQSPLTVELKVIFDMFCYFQVNIFLFGVWKVEKKNNVLEW